MRRVVVIAAVLVFSIGCQQKGEKEKQFDICCGTSADESVFKADPGRELVAASDVSAIEVMLTPYVGSPYHKNISRTFEGDQARALIKQFSLAKPMNEGTPASLPTGTVSVIYKHAGTSDTKIRILTIQNQRLLQDATYPEITYRPTMVIDPTWLAAQPSGPSTTGY